MSQIDAVKLLRFRMVIARYGEMDLQQWWDTQGMLAKPGRIALGRGLPRTHWGARARAVFFVAAARCREIYSPPGGFTLWNLPADIESQFEECWPVWIQEREMWCDICDSLEVLGVGDLLSGLAALSPVSTDTMESLTRMRRAADKRAVPLGEVDHITDELIEQLAIGFSKAEPGRLAVPYVTLRRDA